MIGRCILPRVENAENKLINRRFKAVRSAGVPSSAANGGLHQRGQGSVAEAKCRLQAVSTLGKVVFRQFFRAIHPAYQGYAIRIRIDISAIFPGSAERSRWSDRDGEELQS